MKKYITIISWTVSLGIFLPVIAFAAGIVPCDGVIVKCDINALATLINNIINWFIGISVSVAAVVFAYAGGQMLLHPGEPAKLENAKKMLFNTIIGMAWILGAWLIIHTVISAIASTSKGQNPLLFLKGN